MQQLPTKLDLKILIREAERLDYRLDGSKTTMAFPQSGGLPDNPILLAAAEEISVFRGQPPLNMMVNRQPAGVIVPWHTDTLQPSPSQGDRPRLERWHLPLVTNPAATFEYRDISFHLSAGFWWGPVAYWKEHRVVNLGLEPRIHLIVDLDSP